MALNSSDVNAGDDILSQHHNFLIDDIEQHNHDGTDTAKLSIGVEFASPIIRYYSIPLSHFVSEQDTVDWLITNQYLTRRTTIGTGDFYAAMHLPHDAIVTSFKTFWFRDDAAASGISTLFRLTPASATLQTMANADSDSSAGLHSVEDTSISFATIDNAIYVYEISIRLNPNDNVNDIRLLGVIIKYTITRPLP